ncbi:hypothetical protein [Benzoatithermus flavus]|uniref:Lipoprotein n=1 Tax=Benzoatithermus flavus TaxID=3108223 RepID=A0ABU8XMW7_9PROT
MPDLSACLPCVPLAPALLASALLLAACTGPDVVSGPAANPSAARGLLVAAAAEGRAVPLAIDTVPPVFSGGSAEIAGTATAGVSWLRARFEPVGLGNVDHGRRRLVFRFEDVPHDPVATCSASPPRGGLPPPPLQLYAVFCDGPRPVADVNGRAADSGPAAADQLVAAVTNRLFPGSDTGYSYFPGISLGVGVGSGGGWGLGGGLHF